MSIRFAWGVASTPLIFLVTMMLVVSVSCGRGGGPTTPDLGPGQGANVLTPPNERNARAPESYANHSCWGFFTMVLDRENETIEVIENRELAVHLNVKDILQSDWWCPAKNCIQIQFLNLDDPYYTIKGTLVNPTYFTGYDVRVIIFLDEKGHELLNADDFTMLYEDGDDINPFRSFAKTTPNREFSPYSSASEIFELYVPPDPKKFMIDFAIDASWPDNCPEPYDLQNFGYEGSIYPDDPDLTGIDQGVGMIFTEVHDWQLNVTEVSVDTTPITGGITILDYNIDNDRWEATITNSEDADPGEYVCLIASFSEDDPSIGLYNYLTVTVDETPPPAVQTIWGRVGDAVYLDDLDGAVVSVVNQDPVGFTPELTSVVNGEYCVNVTTGAFNVSVTIDDGVHLSQVATDVIVTENEDVHLNFGLLYPNQPDQYDPFGWEIGWWEIQGFAGRVVDPLGMPISGATIELTSPDSPLIGQDILQAEITDDNGYFSMTNVFVADTELSIPLTTYRMRAAATGYYEMDVGVFLATPNRVPYTVIELQPHGEIPVWEESFEDESGWTFGGYYHRQLYDPSITNMSFDPMWNLVITPPDEVWGGAIPPPTDGNYYLWYGVEADGNILGAWSGNAGGPYSGGTSISWHSGTATAPAIDLSGYTQARVEFDMCYSMESMDVPFFEIMYFYVNTEQVGFYNIFVDPDTAAYTYTQRGHNRTLIWCHYVHDISAHAGDFATLSFYFSTEDSLYNGFRGQFIDNIQVFAQ